MRPTYGALRLWSTGLITVGFLGVVSGVIGTIFAVMQAVTFAQGPATLLIGGTLAVLFVSRAEPVREDNRQYRPVRPGAAG
jgi:hypothetical protein